MNKALRFQIPATSSRPGRYLRAFVPDATGRIALPEINLHPAFGGLFSIIVVSRKTGAAVLRQFRSGLAAAFASVTWFSFGSERRINNQVRQYAPFGRRTPNRALRARLVARCLRR